MWGVFECPPITRFLLCELQTWRLPVHTLALIWLVFSAGTNPNCQLRAFVTCTKEMAFDHAVKLNMLSKGCLAHKTVHKTGGRKELVSSYVFQFFQLVQSLIGKCAAAAWGCANAPAYRSRTVSPSTGHVATLSFSPASGEKKTCDCEATSMRGCRRPVVICFVGLQSQCYIMLRVLTQFCQHLRFKRHKLNTVRLAARVLHCPTAAMICVVRLAHCPPRTCIW